MKITALIMLIALTAPLCEASTKTLTADDIMDRVEAAEQDIKTLEISYKQEIKVTYTNQVQNSSGKAFFLKPEKIRIDIEKPYREVFITDGNTVWFHNLEFNHVMRGKWKELEKSGRSVSMNLPKSLFNLGSSATALKDTNNIEYEGLREGMHVLKLSPKESSGYVIVLYINDEDYFPVKTSLLTASVEIHTTVLEYKKNADIDRRIFRFRKPPGVEIMEIPL